MTDETRGRPTDDTDFFQMEDAIASSGDVAGLNEGQWRAVLRCDRELGRMDRYIHHAVASPHKTSLSPNEQAVLLTALVMMGRGDVLKSGQVPLTLSEKQPELVSLAAGGLIQAGDARAAGALLTGLAEKSTLDEFALRYLGFAISVLAGGDQAALTRQFDALRGQGHGRWLDYEQLRYGLTPPPKALPVARRASIRRDKHIGRPYPMTPDRVLLGEEARGLKPRARELPTRLSANIEAAVEATEKVIARSEPVRRRLAFLLALRGEYAPDAGSPIQVISTGRAGTTSLFEWLDHASAYMPFHSFSWQTTPMHRWGMTARLVEGHLSPEDLAPFVELYLFCRVSEIAAAYRAGKTPVVVSHWDGIFAPISAALFGTRFIALRRNDRDVLTSMIGKRQYSCTQAALLPHTTYKEGGLVFDASDFSADWGFHIAWFLAFTDRVWEGLTEILPDQCISEISSDSLFAGDGAALSGLFDAFDEVDRDEESARKHFARRINEKAWKATGVTPGVSGVTRDAAEWLERLRGIARRSNGA